MKKPFLRMFSSLFTFFALIVMVIPANAAPRSSLIISPLSGKMNSLDSSKVRFQEVASGFAQPLFITNAGDGSGRMFIVERTGQIKILKNGAILPAPFLDIHTIIKSNSSEQGLLALAFHPSYETNGQFFVVYTAPRNDGDNSGSNVILERFSVSANPDLANSGSGVILRTISHPINSNHNGGTLAFGQDGYLYWSIGDGGGGGDLDNNAQNLNSLLGKILRLDVDSTAPYIPNDNPFYNNPSPSIRKEIWAFGLRNPWRFSFDRLTKDMYIGDVGQGVREEIDFQPAASKGGENYGWRVMEGSLCYNDPSGSCSMAGKVLPVAEYNHSPECSVTGGYVYRGTTYPALVGYYFFGDYCSGKVFSLYKDISSGWIKTQIADLPYNISTFGEDEAGNLYLTSYSTGKIYQIQYHDIAVVNSITRADHNPTNVASVDFTVQFSEPVTGVDLGDFILTTSGVSGAAKSGISGLGSTYTVTVDTGSGDGTIRLDLVDDDSIVGTALNPLGGPGVDNGSFNTGESYTMDYTPPGILSIVRAKASPSAAANVSFRVTFSESVTAVDSSDFSLSIIDLMGAAITQVSGFGDSYTVTVNTGSGDGSIHLDAIDDGTIMDLAFNPLTGGFTGGEDYSIDKAQLSAPALRSPRMKAVINNDQPVLWWRRVQGAQTYEFEVATDDTFATIIESGTAPGLSYTVAAPLGDDDYFWRVRARNVVNQPGAWSPARSFTLDTSGPAAPGLSFPMDNANTRTPTFRWAKVATAIGYEFQYDDAADFLTPLYTAAVRNNFRRPPVMEVGTFYWRVRAKDALGNWGDWSAYYTVKIMGP